MACARLVIVFTRRIGSQLVLRAFFCESKFASARKVGGDFAPDRLDTVRVGFIWLVLVRHHNAPFVGLMVAARSDPLRLVLLVPLLDEGMAARAAQLAYRYIVAEANRLSASFLSMAHCFDRVQQDHAFSMHAARLLSQRFLNVAAGVIVDLLRPLCKAAKPSVGEYRFVNDLVVSANAHRGDFGKREPVYVSAKVMAETRGKRPRFDGDRAAGQHCHLLDQDACRPLPLRPALFNILSITSLGDESCNTCQPTSSVEVQTMLRYSAYMLTAQPFRHRLRSRAISCLLLIVDPDLTAVIVVDDDTKKIIGNMNHFNQAINEKVAVLISALGLEAVLELAETERTIHPVRETEE